MEEMRGKPFHLKKLLHHHRSWSRLWVMTKKFPFSSHSWLLKRYFFQGNIEEVIWVSSLGVNFLLHHFLLWSSLKSVCFLHNNKKLLTQDSSHSTSTLKSPWLESSLHLHYLSISFRDFASENLIFSAYSLISSRHSWSSSFSATQWSLNLLLMRKG